MTAFDIDRIDDEIAVSVIVPGGSGMKGEKKIHRPLKVNLPKQSQHVPFDDLQPGKSYRVLRQVPLMGQNPSSGKVMGAPSIQYLKRGTTITVIEVESVHGWYRVQVQGNSGIVGWINPKVLLKTGVERAP